MKNYGIGFGLAALLAVGTANAGPVNAIYDTITGGQSPSDGGALSLLNQAVGSPAGDSFSVSGPTQLRSITLRLADATPTDGGSILVYLVPNDPARNAPWTNGTANSTSLTGKILLGTILDSALPTAVGSGACALLTACNTTVSTTAFITSAGRYWIELVNSSLTIETPSNAVWEYTTFGAATTGGIGTSGEFQSWQNSLSPNGLTANNLVSNHGSFEMTVTTPEPASLALLGAGMFGLGAIRRRRAKKAAQ